MHNITFDVLDKNMSDTRIIDHLINKLNGEFKKTTTKDGWVFQVSFPTQEVGEIFEQQLRQIAPHIFT